MSKLFTKDPQEVLDFQVDWSDFTDAVGSPQDVISASTWTLPNISPTELVSDSESFTNDSATIFVSGGTEGEAYQLLNQIVTTGGRTYERIIYVHVVDSSSGSFTASLIVEDGTIVLGANSYDTLAGMDAYHARRNNSTWFAATAPLKTGAAIKGASYMVQRYRTRWQGIRVDVTQTLDWPRAGVVTEDYYEPQSGPRDALFPDLAFVIDSDVIPDEVKHAQAELALRALTVELNPDLDRGGDLKRFKAGSVEIEYGSAATPTTTYKAIDDILKPFLKPTGVLLRG